MPILMVGLKYGHRDLRNILERSSARETTVRVAAGAVAKKLLSELGIEVGFTRYRNWWCEGKCFPIRLYPKIEGNHRNFTSPLFEMLRRKRNDESY